MVEVGDVEVAHARATEILHLDALECGVACVTAAGVADVEEVHADEGEVAVVDDRVGVEVRDGVAGDACTA